MRNFAIGALAVLALCALVWALKVPHLLGSPSGSRSGQNSAAPAENSGDLSADDLANMSAEDVIAHTDKQAGKADWEIDCDRAFMGNLAAARRVKETVERMTYGQRSQRTDFCLATAERTIKMGGYNSK